MKKVLVVICGFVLLGVGCKDSSVSIPSATESTEQAAIQLKITELENRILLIENRLDNKDTNSEMSSVKNRVSDVETNSEVLEDGINDLANELSNLTKRFDNHQSCLRLWNTGTGPAMQDDIWHCSNK